jgi:hypothetical protein
MKTANGNLFHLPGTLTHKGEDGELLYTCPHCGTRPIPKHREEELASQEDQDSTDLHRRAQR